jgi:hypothetical protein
MWDYLEQSIKATQEKKTPTVVGEAGLDKRHLGQLSSTHLLARNSRGKFTATSYHAGTARGAAGNLCGAGLADPLYLV